MRFGYRVYPLLPSRIKLQRLLHSTASVFIVVLLALIVASVIYTVSLRYPYLLPTVQEQRAVSLDSTPYTRCSQLNTDATLVNYNILKPLEEPNFECIKTKTSPAVTVCLFDIWHDVFISRSLQSAGIWEPYLVNEFTEAVRRGGPKAGSDNVEPLHGYNFFGYELTQVLDVGANIGYYTLLAAQMRQQVVAVEPVLDSIKRLQHAAHLDDVTQQITVVYNAVADVRMKATLRQSGHNQGDSRIELRVRECTGACPAIINTIVLDDLVDVISFRQAVMKIDIQGYEHYAFQCAGRLFARVHFTHIFMEWEIMRDFYVNFNHTSYDKQLVEQMISFFLLRHFRPYELVFDGAKPLNPTAWSLWPVNIVWIRHINDDEQSYLTRSHHKNWPP